MEIGIECWAVPAIDLLHSSSVFFFCVKIKSVRETIFWPFFQFFHCFVASFGPQAVKHQQCFFFPRENKKCAWNDFFAFFSFFSRVKKFFTHTFLNIFTGTLAFSRALWKKNSRIDFDFSRAETQEFSRKGSNFHAYSFRYLDAQIAQNLNCIIARATFTNSYKS